MLSCFSPNAKQLRFISSFSCGSLIAICVIVSHLSFWYPQFLLLFFAVENIARKVFTILYQLHLLFAAKANCLMAFWIEYIFFGYRRARAKTNESENIIPEGKLMVRNYRHSQTTLNHRLVGIINCRWMDFHVQANGERSEVNAAHTNFPSVNGYHLSVH